MLVSYGGSPDPEFGRRIDQLLDTSPSEFTNEGFEYVVADPEQIGGSSGVIGRVITSHNEIECGLILGADIPRETRRNMATITVASLVSPDRYTLARSCRDFAEQLEASEITELTTHVGTNLDNHRKGIAFSDGKGAASEVAPLTRLTLKSALGWLHITRPLTERGQESVATFEAAELYIPEMKSGLRLSAKMASRSGEQPVGLVFAAEKSEKHTCPCCSGQILKGSTRLTLVQDKARSSMDHHHFHPSCFADKMLGKIDSRTACIQPNPHYSPPIKPVI